MFSLSATAFLILIGTVGPAFRQVSIDVSVRSFLALYDGQKP
jgi:hypothetical protein